LQHVSPTASAQMMESSRGVSASEALAGRLKFGARSICRVFWIVVDFGRQRYALWSCQNMSRVSCHQNQMIVLWIFHIWTLLISRKVRSDTLFVNQMENWNPWLDPWRRHSLIGMTQRMFLSQSKSSTCFKDVWQSTKKINLEYLKRNQRLPTCIW
jgi:hypothetical protein